MRCIIPTAAAVLASFTAHAAAQGSPGPEWSLVFADEFDGLLLNANNWSYQTGTGTEFGLNGWGNNELQNYTNRSANSFVSDGTLKIIARQENFQGSNYTSARIRSINKVDIRYGRIEARMKLPSTTGVWPAFWMLATDSPYGGWAASGEIDVMESVNNADRIYGTIHYGGFFPGNQSNGGNIVTGIDYSQGFHEYAVEWFPDQIRWYLDGQLYHSVTSGQWFSTQGQGNSRAPFDTPFHFLLNVAVGGNFPGNPNGSSQWPQTLEVDYVRAYQIQSGPFGSAPASVPGLIEAEDFDTGYPGEAYRDQDLGNTGGQYRDSDVDIEASSEGGFNIGWIEANEFLQYTIDVQTAGQYLLEMRVASPQIGGPFRVEFDGVNATGTLLAPITGGFQNWFTISKEVTLNAGPQVMRFTTDGGAGNFNLNWFRLTRLGVCSAADFAEPFGELNAFDIFAFIGAYNAQSPDADLAAPFGSFNFFDVAEYITLYNAGCP
jgi:beta-glucanase (GH16 family)